MLGMGKMGMTYPRLLFTLSMLQYRRHSKQFHSLYKDCHCCGVILTLSGLRYRRPLHCGVERWDISDSQLQVHYCRQRSLFSSLTISMDWTCYDRCQNFHATATVSSVTKFFKTPAALIRRPLLFLFLSVIARKLVQAAAAIFLRPESSCSLCKCVCAVYFSRVGVLGEGNSIRALETTRLGRRRGKSEHLL